MNWCLSWWSPDSGTQGVIAVSFWVGVAAAVVWAWKRQKQRHRASSTRSTQGVRAEARGTTEQAPRVGAGRGSER